ncbi:hypothetical protein niasHT_020621 [Heterodera trifolii]|uniref:Gustatory receptor n=1 Tax=Heterodera trifolii TaxID=157864 RepID=A0ABD2KLE6_9BILA
MFISICNFILVLRTALLHTNLKWILLAQSVCICMSELCRFTVIVSKIPAQNIYANQTHFGTQFASVYIFSNIFRFMLSYVLLAERTMATLMFRHYFEQNVDYWMNFLCLIVLLAISYGVQVTQNYSPHEFNQTTFFSVCALIVLQNGAIIVLWLIYTYNKNKYRNANVVLTLNQRFQLSENIRTLKQLAPTFILYSINALLVFGIKFLFIFGWVSNDDMTKLAFIWQTLLLAIVNIGIELTVITHHPLLKRRAIQGILNTVKFCRRNHVSDTQSLHKQKPKSLFGDELIIQSQKQADYFDMLSKAWR